MKITSAENPEVDNLLVTEDDVKVAVFMSKVLTKALSNLTHRHLKAKLSDQFSNLISKQLNSSDLQSQISKIAAAETALTNKVPIIYYKSICIAQNLNWLRERSLMTSDNFWSVYLHFSNLKPPILGGHFEPPKKIDFLFVLTLK